MAAGNGGLDLSDTSIITDYGASGSMLVGVCDKNTGRRLSFSNYGHPTPFINSWGESVTATGYSSLQDAPGHDRDYSNSFSGTSSATPLSSGALVLMQSYAKKYNHLISPQSMRSLILESTYDEGVQDRIGKRPNVDQLFERIDDRVLSPLLHGIPFKSGFSKYDVSFNSASDDEKILKFVLGLPNLGMVTHFTDEGPDELQRFRYGYTTVKVPVIDENNKSFVVYLRMTKSTFGLEITMNSGLDLPGHAQQNLDVIMKFIKEDNQYLPKGKYK